MRFFLFLFTLVLGYSYAQVETVKRIEFDLKDDYFGESIYEFGEDGFIILANTKASSGEVNWKFDKYDNELEFVKSLELSLPKEYYKDETFRDDNNLYLLFKSRKGDYRVVRYSIKT
ncbi:MAG: hypothetical protein EP333_04910, partial [Bacteroidetes bacterium]